MRRVPMDDDLPFSEDIENPPEDDLPSEKTAEEVDSPIANISPEKIDLSSIPIRIDLELARISVSISELQRMQPGQKLPVNINPRIVNLIIDNRTIGRGEIVEV